MTLEFSVEDLSSDLIELRSDIEAIDMDAVKKRSTKRFAEEMAEYVRKAVVNSDIQTPGMNSIYGRGPGPSMSTASAWVVKQDGKNRYSVRPHPKVRQRAIVLNYGYPGRITPNDSEALKFEVKGVPEPVFAKSVSGPDYTGYWQAAMKNLESSGRLEEIANEELEEEVEFKFS